MSNMDSKPNFQENNTTLVFFCNGRFKLRGGYLFINKNIKEGVNFIHFMKVLLRAF